VGDGSPAVHQDADLASDLPADLRQLPCQLVVEQRVGGEAATEETLELASLAGLESVGVAEDLDGRLLDALWRGVGKG
jgi:hypothetical protein